MQIIPFVNYYISIFIIYPYIYNYTFNIYFRMKEENQEVIELSKELKVEDIMYTSGYSYQKFKFLSY